MKVNPAGFKDSRVFIPLVARGVWRIENSKQQKQCSISLYNMGKKKKREKKKKKKRKRSVSLNTK